MRTSTRNALLVLGGVLVVGVVVVAFTRWIPKARFLRALPPEGKPYGELIWRAARRQRIAPALLAAVIAHESGFGLYLSPRGPRGKGDGGHGHGLSQIDDRTWGAWLATHDWGDPAVNLDKGAEILAASLRAFPGKPTAGIAAYNAGPKNVQRALEAGKPPGSVTTHDKEGRSYVENVTRRYQEIQARAA